MAQFRDLMQIMENVPQKQPSQNFTSGVMARLSEAREISVPFSFRRLFATSLNFGFRDSVTRTECAFYFFLTGFFYLVLGFILMLGIWFPPVGPINGWFLFQPFFGLLLAAELTLTGIALYKNGDTAVGFVRAGTLLYAVLIIINCCMGALSVHIPVAIFFAVIFSITGLGMAFLLGLAVERYYPETIFAEVRG